MKHIVLNKYGRPYQKGEEVIVVNKKSQHYDKIGEIWDFKNYDDNPKVLVSFDGEIIKFRPQDIDIN